MSSLSERVSLFQGAADTRVLETVPLGTILERIKSGAYRDRISTLRQHKATPNEVAYREGKKLLPAFTPGCALRTRKKDVPWEQKLVSTTNTVHYDIDAVDDPVALKARLATHPAVVYAFVSPGWGVKVGVAATGITDPHSYQRAWHVALTRLKQSFPDLTITEDEHVKYLHALCFVSDDPDLYVNPNAIPLDIPPAAPEPPEPATQTEGEGPDYSTVAAALAQVPGYDEYKTWIKVGMALHSSGQPWARGLWDSWSAQSAKYKASAQGEKWRSFSRGWLGRLCARSRRRAKRTLLPSWHKFSTTLG
jgi:Primase C terminal 2 (PriCT-2)/VirE N-terminal domain